jgi:predicted SAM-dependent methyltransferase
MIHLLPPGGLSLGMENKRLLNVGGGQNRNIDPEYDSYEHVLLDIDATVKPDIIWDALDLKSLEPSQFDLVYCSHNLEHFYDYQVPIVLMGMLHVLKPGGVVHIRVPDIVGAVKMMLESGKELTDTLYVTKHGFQMRTLDVIYGWQWVIEKTRQPYFAHKTGFSMKTLHTAMACAGFVDLEIYYTDIELKGIGYKPKGVDK